MNKYSQFEMVAIDLDGTLVDSVRDLHAAVVVMQETIGRTPASLDDVRAWVGNGIERLVHRALTRTMDEDAAATDFEQALTAFHSAYRQTNGTVSSLYPDVRDGLDWLTAQNIPLVCVTNKAGNFSRPLLDAMGIAGYFREHIAGDDVAVKKPDPAALLEAARRCEVAPTRCLMIGDSISDIRASKAAGFTCVCVSYGYNHGQSVRELTGELAPDFVIDSFAELRSSVFEA